jgi:hypothetical protein
MTVEEAIRYLIEEKKKERRIPHCAMLEDVVGLCDMPEQELRDELKRLKNEGKISFKQTINSVSIFINQH